MRRCFTRWRLLRSGFRVVSNNKDGTVTYGKGHLRHTIKHTVQGQSRYHIVSGDRPGPPLL